ncbi:MAG TPA: patatin-like phospholipase family protein [Candidatus Acidoferrum sp.]|nr:patatin-like phospholipase family protein [Candidatus Acidoferrum sp.]
MRLAAVPKDQEAAAVVDGMEGIRYWQKSDLPLMIQDMGDAYRRQVAAFDAAGNKGPLPMANYLGISGGGEDGAFGAGLLCGWTAAGTRPEFTLVTGVSTGALSAPFAFLGPKYDKQLKDVYTTITAADVLEERGMLAGIFSDALADNAPLRLLVEKYVTADLLQAIAAEHAKGRVLLIGTTNLDARRPVIWNIGKIAASGNPHALELVQKILVASAAIPAAFPPMMIDVEVNGKPYQEMHVDGGASAQVFVYPPALQLKALSAKAGITRERRLYVIRNSRLDPDWADTKRQTLTIAGRAVSSLIQNQGVGDLYRIYATAQRDGVDFNLAYIPPTFNVTLAEPFDQHYMNELFNVGYELGKTGYDWKKTPPGLDWTVAPEPAPQS